MATQAKRLRFLEPRVEADFRADYFAGVVGGVPANMAFATVLLAVWALVDRVVVPQALSFTLPMRLGVGCPITFGVFLLSYSRRFERLMAPALVVVDLVCGLLMIAIIISAGPDGHRYYYAGLILTAIGCCACPGLGFRASTAVSVTIILAYEATLWSDATPEVVLNNSMFLVTTEILAMSVAYTLERQHRSEFLQRMIIREQADALRAMLHEAERNAVTDPLTGLFNRRHFFAEAACRRGRVSVIILDVDHFKSINDVYGHASGDRVLRELARRIEAAVRPGDIACRYGGEEFALLLSGADRATAAAVGERIRLTIASAPVDVISAEISVTISVGIASNDDASTIEALVDRADQALYEAKEAGRDRVRIWDRVGAHLE